MNAIITNRRSTNKERCSLSSCGFVVNTSASQLVGTGKKKIYLYVLDYSIFTPTLSLTAVLILWLIKCRVCVFSQLVQSLIPLRGWYGLTLGPSGWKLWDAATLSILPANCHTMPRLWCGISPLGVFTASPFLIYLASVPQMKFRGLGKPYFRLHLPE